MNKQELKKLASALVKSSTNPTYNFSVTNENGETIALTREAMNDTLRQELNEMCQDRYSYERNKVDLFEIIQESVDAVLPPELERFFEGFTEIRQFGPKDKPEFVLRRDPRNLRARSFVTKVSPAGVYEVFRLAGRPVITLEMLAIGGAGQIAFEDFLSGRVDWYELVEALRAGMADRVYDEILACLDNIEAKLPTANKATMANFDAAAFNKVLGVVSVYGSPVIFCTEVFAREITEGYDWASEVEKLARRRVGYLADYKGAKIVVIPQSFKDADNAEKVVDDSKAYVLPAGRGPVFYVALQGDTQIREVQNEDWSIELQTYKKFGVAAVTYNDIGVVEITSLA